MNFYDEAIANWFVEKSLSTGAPLTQMQLHKLMYFAHAIHLVNNDKPLVLGTFEAWPYGPVLPNIYAYTKSYGSSKIRNQILVPNSKGDLIIPIINREDIKAKKSLETAWKQLSSKTARQLSDLSHEIGSPWDQAYLDDYKEQISNESIKKFYSSKAAK